jgi:hypothetical protein
MARFQRVFPVFDDELDGILNPAHHQSMQTIQALKWGGRRLGAGRPRDL